jgi:curved DNA-binding protein CbpA
MASDEMSIAHALEILGINAGATEQEICAPYNHLMKRVHPDVGGSAYFSKELNAARDVLLKQLLA